MTACQVHLAVEFIPCPRDRMGAWWGSMQRLAVLLIEEDNYEMQQIQRDDRYIGDESDISGRDQDGGTVSDGLADSQGVRAVG